MSQQTTNQVEQTAVATTPKQEPLIVQDNSPFANLLDTGKFDHLWRVALCFSKSELVPIQFQGKPENCMIGIQMALRCRVDPFMFLQNCYVVKGRPGIESKLALALLNASGLIQGRVRYKLEGEGKTRQCTAFVTDRATGELYSQTVDWAMVEAEGWNQDKRTQSGQVIKSKWNTMPDLMFQYRSAMFLIRLHYSDVIMGLQSREELEDIEPMPVYQATPVAAIGPPVGKSQPTPRAKPQPKVEPAPEPEPTPEAEDLRPETLQAEPMNVRMADAELTARANAELAKIDRVPDRKKLLFSIGAKDGGPYTVEQAMILTGEA